MSDMANLGHDAQNTEDSMDNVPSQGRRKLTWYEVVSLAGTVLGVILGLLVLFDQEVRDGLWNVSRDLIRFSERNWLVEFGAIAIVLSLIAIWRTRSFGGKEEELNSERRKNHDLNGQVEQLSSALSVAEKAKEQATSEITRLEKKLEDCIPYKKSSKGRWESLSIIRYGHIDYPPFLRHNGITGKPTGPAVDLLTQLLAPPSSSGQIKVEPKGGLRNWDNIFEGLNNEDYDVVATPLFATFTRSKTVRFTTPLFFSNIGFYVREELADLKSLTNLTVSRLPQAIKTVKLDLLSIEGEISCLLSEKYGDEDRRLSPYGPDSTLSDLFEQVANPENETSALFCESYYAAHQPLVKSGQVKNVLNTHEILYPVCFAVRIGDYQLANLLNIRLLAMARETGVLEYLTELLPNDKDHQLKRSEISLHFVSKWPCAIDIKDGTHA